MQALSSPRALPPGTPLDLRLADINGDGATDALTVVDDDGTPTVAFYLSDEPGVFDDAQFVSPSRVGARAAELAVDLGDWNRDGVLDLFVGWGTNGLTDRNVRVLFGGSR